MIFDDANHSEHVFTHGSPAFEDWPSYHTDSTLVGEVRSKTRSTIYLPGLRMTTILAALDAAIHYWLFKAAIKPEAEILKAQSLSGR